MRETEFGMIPRERGLHLKRSGAVFWSCAARERATHLEMKVSELDFEVANFRSLSFPDKAITLQFVLLHHMPYRGTLGQTSVPMSADSIHGCLSLPIQCFDELLHTHFSPSPA